MLNRLKEKSKHDAEENMNKRYGIALSNMKQ